MRLPSEMWLEIIRYLSPAAISTLSKVNYGFYQLVRPYRNIMILFNKDAHPFRTARNVTHSSRAKVNVDVLQWSSGSNEDQPLQSSSALLSAYPLSVRVVFSNASSLTQLHTIILSSIILSTSHQASLAEFPSLCRLILHCATFDNGGNQSSGSRRLRLKHLSISAISIDGCSVFESGISHFLTNTAETLESLSLREVSAGITRLHMRYSYPKLLMYRFISHAISTEVLTKALAQFLKRTPTIQHLDLRWVEPLCLELDALPNLRHCSTSYRNLPTLVRGRPVTSISMVHLDCLYSTAEMHILFKGIRKCSSPITQLNIHIIWNPQHFSGVRLAGTALSQLVQVTLWITFSKIGRHDPCLHGNSLHPRTIQELHRSVELRAPPCPCYTEHRQIPLEISLPRLQYLRILTCSHPPNGQDRRISLEIGARYFRNVILPLNTPNEAMPELIQVEFLQFAYDRVKFIVDEDRVLRYWKDVYGHGGWEVTVCETAEGLKAGNRNMRQRQSLANQCL
jgi:hypothetical protein